MAAHSSLFAWKISWTEEPGGLCPWGHKELDTTERGYAHRCIYTPTYLNLGFENTRSIVYIHSS